MEIERKFLVCEPPDALQTAAPVRLRQGYIATDAEAEVRLRDADGGRTLTVKSGSGLVRDEYEIGLTPDQFEALWPATGGRRLEKIRYTIPAGDVRYEIDTYGGALDGLVVAEVEFGSVDEARAFEPPGWFGREVTDDPAYSNASIALHGVPPDVADVR